MQTTIKKLIEVCLRYHDNSKLCRLPPPPPVTPSVSASAAKNIRRTMEDRHIVINDLHALFGIEVKLNMFLYFFEISSYLNKLI